MRIFLNSTILLDKIAFLKKILSYIASVFLPSLAPHLSAPYSLSPRASTPMPLPSEKQESQEHQPNMV